MFFRRVVIFSKRNWAGSKVFSHASASHDYIGLLDQTLDPRVDHPFMDHPIEHFPLFHNISLVNVNASVNIKLKRLSAQIIV